MCSDECGPIFSGGFGRDRLTHVVRPKSEIGSSCEFSPVAFRNPPSDFTQTVLRGLIVVAQDVPA